MNCLSSVALPATRRRQVSQLTLFFVSSFGNILLGLRMSFLESLDLDTPRIRRISRP